jgi:hypothetical protein
MAHAEQNVELPKTLAHLVVSDSWKAIRVPSIVAAYKRDDGALLAITRADVPNADAWSKEKDKKQAYADSVAAGVKASLTGTKTFKSKLTEMNGVPALDCEGTRDGASVFVRVLLFRTYALSLAIELPKSADPKSADPKGAEAKAAREILSKFGPTKPIPKD